MSFSASVSILTAALLLIIHAILKTIRFRMQRRLPFPPGPPALPVIGNLLDLPKTEPWITFAGLKKEHGDIAYLKVFNSEFVIINSHAVAVELLEKRGSIYSDRPFLTMSCGLCGWSSSPTFMKHGPKLRDARRMMRLSMGPGKVLKHLPMIGTKLSRYIERLQESPQDFLAHNKWFITAIIMELTYGYTILDKDDPRVRIVEEVADELNHALEPGAWLVDVFPILQHIPSWLPGAGFRKTAEYYKSSSRRIVDPPYLESKKEMKNEKLDNNTFVSQVLRSYGKEGPTPEQEDLIMWTCATLYVAGTETTNSSLSSFFLAMALYPHVQARARDEVLSFFGSSGQDPQHDLNGEFPNLSFSDSDRAALPYTSAVLKEILRWGVTAPTGLPHATAQDDEYNGCMIPKGSVIMVALWGIFNDPEMYDNPEEFNPERYTQEAKEMDPAKAAFGYGRRTCPGMDLSLLVLFNSIVRVLYYYEILPPLDENGEVTMPARGLKGSTVVRPAPFECRIVRRDGGS